MKSCKGCGRDYSRAEFRGHPSTFARAKYCGIECFRARMRRSAVVPVPEWGVAVIALAPGLDRGALISIEDVPLVEGRSWVVDSTGYVRSHLTRLHSLLMKPPAGLVVDHINREKLDNRRSNLRVVSHLANQRNHGLFRTNTSGATGVYSVRRLSGVRWVAAVFVDGRRRILGSFASAEEAARVRQSAEAAMHEEAR